uniref:Uncharacterized protein n=1 Tax=Anguilla anguilla TaxID=7936 RepID=A0A0E9V506_ANGAN
MKEKKSKYCTESHTFPYKSVCWKSYAYIYFSKVH